MNTVMKKYNDNACDVFDNVHVMSICEAKTFIDDAYTKRALVRKMIQSVRREQCHINMAWEAYRQSQKLCVRAYNKYLNDMRKGN